MALSIGTCVFYRLEELPGDHHPKSDMSGGRDNQLVFRGVQRFACQEALTFKV